jgi:hypothetical protein
MERETTDDPELLSDELRLKHGRIPQYAGLPGQVVGQ